MLYQITWCKHFYEHFLLAVSDLIGSCFSTKPFPVQQVKNLTLGDWVGLFLIK